MGFEWTVKPRFIVTTALTLARLIKGSYFFALKFRIAIMSIAIFVISVAILTSNIIKSYVPILATPFPK